MRFALPSEAIEPMLEGAVCLCIRELMNSRGDERDFEKFAEQLRGIDRVATCNGSFRSYEQDNGTGVHASLATSNAYRMAYKLKGWPEERRRDFLTSLRESTLAELGG